MWSEVMDADAFAAFEEAGDVFDPVTADRLEQFILSAGGSRPADELYLDVITSYSIHYTKLYD